MTILDLLLSSSFITFLLILWFKKSEIILCILTFFHIGWDSLKIFEYYQYKKNSFDIDYPKYLLKFHPNILTELLNCKFCLAFWMSMMYIVNNNISFVIGTAVFSLMWYSLIFKEE